MTGSEQVAQSARAELRETLARTLCGWDGGMSAESIAHSLNSAFFAHWLDTKDPETAETANHCYKGADLLLPILEAYASQRVAEAVSDPIEAPENGETDPQWRAIKRAIDQFVGRVPTITKHRAANSAHIKAVVDRLDAAGDREAADTIVWLCWHRALDRERERFLLADAEERLAALRALTPPSPLAPTDTKGPDDE